MRCAGPAGRSCPGGREPGAGAGRRAGCGQDGAVGLPGRAGVGVPGSAGCGCPVGDGTGIRRIAAAVLADAGPAGAAARSAAGRGAGRVRGRRRGAPGPGFGWGGRGGPGGGVPEADARARLDWVTAGPLDERVRDRIVAETRGNPLALAEQGRMVRPAQLAGGFGLPGAAPVAAVDESFRRRVEALPAQTRRLLLVAAAAPTGDPGPGWRAAGRPRACPRPAMAAAEAGLAEFGTRVVFRHPLVRSAAYQSSSGQDRLVALRALAVGTDPLLDPVRQAQLRAQDVPGYEGDSHG